MHQQTVFPALLESVLTRSEADGAYVYRFENGGETARLSGWAGAAPTTDFEAVQGRHACEHFDRDAPIVLHDHAWSDPRFASFPEFAANRFSGVVSIPLHHAGSRAGLLNVCREKPASLSASELAFLFSLSLPVGALLEASAANDKLAQQLADRKLLDRAKGLLQANNSWTEEEAYLHLRRTSRQRRTAMREIALEIIESGDLHLVEARHAS
jgi:ANTAR domain/GAF domain